MTRIVTTLLLLLLGPFFFHGLIVRIKARWSGRRGPPLWQLFYDCLRLLRKGQVISPVTTPVFQIAPTVSWASVVAAGLFIPLGTERALVDFPGNFVAFAYVLALGRFFTIIAALDTGSSFEGMGASREATFSGLAEPALFIVLATLAGLTGQSSLGRIVNHPPMGSGGEWLLVSLCVPALLIILLTEAGRMPVDDPTTHLELTMIHEVMILDHSGIDLALFSHAAAIKLVVFDALIANLLIPPGVSPLLRLALFIFIQCGMAVSIGWIESWLARLRLSHVPQFIFVALSLALTVMAIGFILRFGGLAW